MIRYVLAALLTVAVLGLGWMALDQTAPENTERELQAAISDIEEAAIDLAEHEEVSPPEHPDPQRVVEFTIPPDDLTTEGVSHFEIDPVDENASIARYVLDDGTRSEEVVDERIVYYEPTENRTTELGGRGTERLRLVLLADDRGEPVVVARPNESVTG
ncbi:DUF7311 family protein [Halopiger goleimassiliensis]|uniref:DUF7311 family protein n=1 Tax=Halopiger goleimassiliensis TaxID=1293048 RepID=UPI000677C635|nr:hypothetical protein [Halopiger goleimassiliensis]